MYTEVVEWVPRAADELTDRKRLVRTTDDADLGLDSIAMAAGVLASPVLAIWAPAPMPGRLFASLALGIFFALGYGLSRHGLVIASSLRPPEFPSRLHRPVELVVLDMDDLTRQVGNRRNGLRLMQASGNTRRPTAARVQVRIGSSVVGVGVCSSHSVMRTSRA